MSRKHQQIRVYFREQPTNYYSVSAVSVKAAIRQARQCAKGLIGYGPRSRLHVEKVEILDTDRVISGRALRTLLAARRASA